MCGWVVVGVGWGLIPFQESLCKMQTQEKDEALTQLKVAWVFPLGQQGPDGLWIQRLEEGGRYLERPLKDFFGGERALELIH